jgi:Gram-negative bacterial TonB protein C-terminal
VWEVRGLSDGLTEQAIKVVRQWRFKPGQDMDGNPVDVMVPIDVSFRLM